LEQIKKNQPSLEEAYTREIASVIHTVSKKYNIKAHKIAAIAMQESSYQLDAKNCYKIKGKERCDYCMMQINDRTADSFGFDKERLTTDLHYCVDAGAQVLRDFKRMYGNKELEWWTRYNSSDDEKRQLYKEKVERWL
jgi:membrane-bound lytic murein transglycosylase MltF